MAYQSPRHSIKYVANRTGLSTHAIRVWERRYEAIVPERTDTNRRLYSDADIDRLRLLKQVSDAGNSIGRIAAMSNDELKELLELHRDTLSPYPFGISTDDPELLVRCQQAVVDLDNQLLYDTLVEARVALPMLPFLESIVGPLVTWIGVNWHEGNIRVAHEHLASAAINAVLSGMLAAQQPPQGAPVIIVGAPAGQLHEIGPYMAANVAAAQGWSVKYMGPNIPLEEIAHAAQKQDAKAVAFSVAIPGDDPALVDYMKTLRQMLPEPVGLFLGGRGVPFFEADYRDAGVLCMDTLAHFNRSLQDFRSSPVSA